jgi:ribosomal protein S18 acetylase RimI-like enzyme
MTKIRKVSPDEIPELSVFAAGIVKEHFDPLIGAAQNDYMIARFQSPEALKDQFAHGYRYYWLLEDGEKAGFTAFFPRDGKMYLSKFYIHRSFRGQHLARKLLDFVLQETEKEGLDKIFLNVNKDNADVIAIYRHFGFGLLRTEKNDIGGGFYMDDEVLELSLPPQSCENM